MRFVVTQHGESWYIRDTEYKKYATNKRAVPILFKSKDRPERICNLMNAEWQEVLLAE